MPVAGLSIRLRLTSIPEELNFTVTDLENQKVNSSSTSFGGPNRYMDDFKKNKSFTVIPGHADGMVIKTVHSSTEAFGAGEILSSTMRFKIHGAVGSQKIEKRGYFQFSSTDWGRIGRPDYSILLFQVDGSDARQVHQKTPTLVEPDPFYCAVAAKDGKIALVVSQENNLGTTVLSNVMDGILKVHSKAFSWVIGI